MGWVLAGVALAYLASAVVMMPRIAKAAAKRNMSSLLVRKSEYCSTRERSGEARRRILRSSFWFGLIWPLALLLNRIESTIESEVEDAEALGRAKKYLAEEKVRLEKQQKRELEDFDKKLRAAEIEANWKRAEDQRSLETERLKVEELRLSVRNKGLEEQRIQREKKGA